MNSLFFCSNASFMKLASRIMFIYKHLGNLYTYKYAWFCLVNFLCNKRNLASSTIFTLKKLLGQIFFIFYVCGHSILENLSVTPIVLIALHAYTHELTTKTTIDLLGLKERHKNSTHIYRLILIFFLQSF